jgi:hypothetical protein
MIIREIAEFRIEDCLFKLADFSYSDRLPIRKLELRQQLLILAQQSETFSWCPIDVIVVECTDIKSVISQAKAYFIWKAVNCLKYDFREHGFNEVFYKTYPKGISESQLTESTKPSHILSFGKYKGQVLENVIKSDPDYIFWLLENVATFRDTMRDTVDKLWDDLAAEEYEVHSNFENL